MKERPKNLGDVHHNMAAPFFAEYSLLIKQYPFCPTQKIYIVNQFWFILRS